MTLRFFKESGMAKAINIYYLSISNKGPSLKYFRIHCYFYIYTKLRVRLK